MLEIKVSMVVIRIMMMKNFKEWIKENCYWRYVETNGILGVALDDPQIVEEESCRYDLVLKIDEDVKINDFINSRSFTIKICCFLHYHIQQKT